MFGNGSRLAPTLNRVGSALFFSRYAARRHGASNNYTEKEKRTALPTGKRLCYALTQVL